MSQEITNFRKAAFHGQLSKLSKLLQKVDINSRINQNQYTALHYASFKGHANVVKYLIENGAMVDAKEINGFTPLYCAAYKGKLEIVKCLIENGAMVDAKNIDDCTPLHIAAQEGELEVVKCLVENGAMVDAKRNDGGTPLYFAAREGKLEIVKCLIENGADIDQKLKDQTPLYIAAKNGHRAVVDYLTGFKRRQAENEIPDHEENWKSAPCIVCLVPRVDVFVLWPCGHVSMCESCCAKMMSQNSRFKCPTCRKPVETYKKIFLQCPDTSKLNNESGPSQRQFIRIKFYSKFAKMCRYFKK